MQKKKQTYEDVAKLFIKTFVQKTYQERYLFLLSKGGDRWEKGVDELRKQSKYKSNFIRSLPQNLSNEDIELMLRKYGAGEKAFVISEIEEADGDYVDILYAIERLAYSWGGIISCIPGKLAFVINEYNCDRFILKKEG